MFIGRDERLSHEPDQGEQEPDRDEWEDLRPPPRAVRRWPAVLRVALYMLVGMMTGVVGLAALLLILYRPPAPTEVTAPEAHHVHDGPAAATASGATAPGATAPAPQPQSSAAVLTQPPLPAAAPLPAVTPPQVAAPASQSTADNTETRVLAEKLAHLQAQILDSDAALAEVRSQTGEALAAVAQLIQERNKTKAELDRLRQERAEATQPAGDGKQAVDQSGKQDSKPEPARQEAGTDSQHPQAGRPAGLEVKPAPRRQGSSNSKQAQADQTARWGSKPAVRQQAGADAQQAQATPDGAANEAGGQDVQRVLRNPQPQTVVASAARTSAPPPPLPGNAGNPVIAGPTAGAESEVTTQPLPPPVALAARPDLSASATATEAVAIPRPPAEIRLRVYIHYRAGSRQSEQAANQVAQRLLFSDFVYAETRSVKSSPWEPTIRYYFGQDAEAAGRLGAILNADGSGYQLQDYSQAKRKPARGTLAIWVPG